MNALFVPTDDAEKNARKLFLSGKLIEAEAECRRAVFISPTVNGKPWNTGALQLLGEICLLQKRNQGGFGVVPRNAYHNTRSTELDLDVALAYCRLGNYDMAMLWYSDQVLLGNVITPQDLPGTLNLRSLEASVLLARGGQASGHAAYQEALIYFETAGKLAPHNGLIASMTGEMLSNGWVGTPRSTPPTSAWRHSTGMGEWRRMPKTGWHASAFPSSHKKDGF